MAAAEGENAIPKLQELAFEVFFDKILYKSTPNSVQFIQDLIDNHLVGRVKYDTRRKCIAKMNEIFYVQFNSMSEMLSRLDENQEILKKYKIDSSMKEKDVMDEFAQLNSSLDENFEELTVNTPIPIVNSFPTLMSLITRRSPNLKRLCITFFHTSYKLANLSSESVIAQDFRLCCLTSLNLHYETSMMMIPTSCEDPFSGDNQSILSVVGKCCPTLTILNVALGFPLKKKDLLGLILGEKASVITDDARWNEDPVLVELQIPTEFLNPLCLTLQKLTLSSSGSYDWFQPERDIVNPSLSPFVYAFALRHLSKLRKVDLETSIINLFKIIHNVKKMGIQQKQVEFEETCRTVAQQYGLEPNSILSPTPFTCFSSIEKLFFSLGTSDADTLRAISSLCPNLNRIDLKQGHAGSSYGLQSVRAALFPTSTTALVDDSPDNQLESILRGMLQVKSGSLDGMNPKFCKLVLDVFGDVLTSLDLFGCGPIIDMALLGVCGKLENLSIVHSPINLEDVAAASCWTPETFLPHLSHFRTNACLGVWAPLMIERKCILVDISIQCSHIATDAHNPRLEWSQVPSLWPMIESLDIWHSKGLTMTTVAELIPKLPKLRKISLHESILAEDPDLSKKIIEDFGNRKKPVDIDELCEEEISCAFLES